MRKKVVVFAVVLAFLSVAPLVAFGKASVPDDTAIVFQGVQRAVRKAWKPDLDWPTHVVVAFRVDRAGRISNVSILSNATAAQKKGIVAQMQHWQPLQADGLRQMKDLFMDVQFDLDSTVAPPLGLTVKQAIERYGASARAKLQPKFAAAKVKYPPAKILLICLKQEKILQMFASGTEGGKLKLVATYPLSTFSGVLGPKLRRGDMQIPEGFYKILGERADSRLALSVNYPNEFDRTKAKGDNRKSLGSDILVHGGTVSTGCVVISNDDMAEVFTTVYDVGSSHTSLIIAPCNLASSKPAVDFSKEPKWLPDHYASLGKALTSIYSSN